jgi:catechol 2,3-dioxygenase-like lactoylglutathione lyase family enzyme
MTSSNDKDIADGYVALRVADLARSIAFWRDGLGLAVSGEWPQQCAVRAGGFELLLDATGEMGELRGEIGIRLSRAQLDNALARLKGQGVQPFRGPKDYGGPLGYEAGLHSPDGHVVVLFSLK